MIPHLTLYRQATLLGLMSLWGCGGASDGFLSEANVCNPKIGVYAESEALDAAEVGELIAGPSVTRASLAQKTATLPAAAELWGVELRLSSTTSALDALHLDFFTGREGADDTPESFGESRLPDGSFGKQIFDSQVVRNPVSITAGEWVSVRFPKIVALAAGDYNWILLSPAASSSSVDVSWNTVSGSGLMDRAQTESTFTPKTGQLARYRFIACE